MKREGKRGRRASLLTCALAACLTLAGVLVGCASDTQGDGGAAGGETPATRELRAGSTAYFYAESMDPASGWDGWEMQYYGITENLLKLNDDFTVEPWLASSCENVDELTWRFTLRDDVTFSNGEKMTGEVVKACLERTYAENTRASETLAISGIEADGQTVTITTQEPAPSFVNVMCDPIFSIYYTGDDVDYAVNTPCTGPYVIDEFVAEDYATLVPNESYWDGVPGLDKITLTCYADDDSMIMAMQNGELDVLAMPGASAHTILSEESGYVHLSQTSTRADFVRFNMAHPVVANDAVRRAVSLCIDREGYAEVINLGTEEPCYGVYSGQLPYGGTDGLDLAVTGCDTEAAAEALDAAGVVDADGDGIRELPDGTPCEINLYNCTAYERFVNLADDLQSKLAEVGIKLTIHSVDYWLQDSETYAGDDPDMTIDSYGMAPTGDAGYFASMSFATGGSNNFGGYSNPEVDALVAQLSATFDEDARARIITQFSQLVLDDAAYVFFANSQTNYITTQGVSGVAVAPSEYYFITKDTTVA